MSLPSYTKFHQQNVKISNEPKEVETEKEEEEGEREAEQKNAKEKMKKKKGTNNVGLWAMRIPQDKQIKCMNPN